MATSIQQADPKYKRAIKKAEIQEKKVTLVQIELKKDLTSQEDNFKARLAQRKQKLEANRSTMAITRSRPLTTKAKLGQLG